jgi:hypothetical protein
VKFPWHGIVLFAFALIFVILGNMFAQFQVMRYALPVYPFFILLPACFLYTIKDRRVFVFFSLALIFSFAINTFNPGKMDNVWKGKRAEYKFTQEPDIPAFIFCQSNYYPLLIPYLHDDQKYVINNSLDSILNTYAVDEFFVIIDDPLVPEIVIDDGIFEILESYKVGIIIYLLTVGNLRRKAL